MMDDDWRLVVAPGPPTDNQRQWDRWLRGQSTPPDDKNVRIDVGRGADGDWSQYWVRDDLALSQADQIVVVTGAEFDPRRRKNNTVLGRCDDPAQIACLLDALATTSDARPFLMTPGSPTIAFLVGRSEVVGIVTVVESAWIRSPLWAGDAPLVAPARLQSWLAQIANG